MDLRLRPQKTPDGGIDQDRDVSLFDAYAISYDEALARGLSITGETSLFFARERVVWLARRLQGLAAHPRQVLDFGCGTGAAMPFFLQYLNADSVIGIDPSASSLAVARQTHLGNAARFFLPKEYDPNGQVDLAFTNGVFHHISPPDRKHGLRYLYQALKPEGILAFWENNPWNLGTRYVMWRIPFDADAVPVWPSEATALLRSVGFEIIRTDFLFIFPRLLRCLRWIEPHLAAYPFGAQYQVLCRKPSAVP